MWELSVYKIEERNVVGAEHVFDKGTVIESGDPDSRKNPMQRLRMMMRDPRDRNCRSRICGVAN